MTPHNRILLLVGGAALVATLAIAAVFLRTSASEEMLQADQTAAHEIQTLGDELLLEVHEQQDALDDYLLSQSPIALDRYRRAVLDERQVAQRIGVGAANLTGVRNALVAIAAENDAWRATVADPSIAAVQSGSKAALDVAIQQQVTDQEANKTAAAEFVGQIDSVVGELHDRAIELGKLRLAAAGLGLAIELFAAGMSLWFVRRYGLRIARDARRRAQASSERIQIMASLRTLKTQASPEATATVIAEALHRLPGIDCATVFECTPDVIVALAVVGLPGLPIQTGDALSEANARSLRDQSSDGPWAQQWIRPAQANADLDTMAALGIKGWAVAPVQVMGELVALIGVMTTDAEQARHLVEDLPAVGEFASVAQAILAPALVMRRERAVGQRRIANAIKDTAFRSVFQPVLELATGRIVGFEALTRFDDGSPPDHVFAAAVECDMGIQLELATLELALRDSRRLPEATWLRLNVSPALLGKGGGTLARILAARTAPIVLEVTEHDAIDAYAPLRGAMARLGPRVRLAVDDVGAGVANFNHLVELRPDFVKIDVGLVRGVEKDPGRQAVVAGLVHFAARTGCQVIAEGVETEAERAMVADLGVTLGQGYLLARPAPVEMWNVASLNRPRTVDRLAPANSRPRPVRSARLAVSGAMPPIVQ